MTRSELLSYRLSFRVKMVCWTPVWTFIAFTIEGSEWRCGVIKVYVGSEVRKGPRNTRESWAPRATQPRSDLPARQRGMTFPSVSGTWNSIRDSFGPASNLLMMPKTSGGWSVHLLLCTTLCYFHLFFESLISVSSLGECSFDGRKGKNV